MSKKPTKAKKQAAVPQPEAELPTPAINTPAGLIVEGSYSIPVGKLETDYKVDTADMNPATLQFIFRHGLKQLINDSHSGIKEAEEVERLVISKIKALETNKITNRASGDDVHTDYKRFALKWLAASTGQSIKSLETFRKTKGITTDKLLSVVCDKLGESFPDIDASIKEKVKQSKIEASESAAMIDLDELA